MMNYNKGKSWNQELADGWKEKMGGTAWITWSQRGGTDLTEWENFMDGCLRWRLCKNLEWALKISELVSPSKSGKDAFGILLILGEET